MLTKKQGIELIEKMYDCWCKGISNIDIGEKRIERIGYDYCALDMIYTVCQEVNKDENNND